jgi:Uma2 family endonuclease
MTTLTSDKLVEKKASRRFLPALENGDHLTQIEFSEIYRQRPDIKKAELIEGVVFMASPVSLFHGSPHMRFSGLLVQYAANTPGLEMADNTSLVLDADNEVQPDLCLWIQASGKVQVTTDGTLIGAPELVVEIAHSSSSIDLHEKFRAYRRNGVQEYVVFEVKGQKTHWFSLQEGRYVTLIEDEQGILQSKVFPGLWFAPAHFWKGDLKGMLKVLQAGLESPEHAAFVNP